jgi:hypothetical protein
MSATSRTPARYAIIDEPRSGPLQRLAMTPLLPFIAYMLFPPLGGVLFAVNALALRARTMWWEIVFAIIGVTLWARLYYLPPAIEWLIGDDAGRIVLFTAWAFAIKYAMLVPLAIGMWCGYKIFLWQSATYEVLSYFDRAGERKGGSR